MSEPQVYLCENPACSLGAVGEPGRFTAGIPPERITMLTGEPQETVLERGEHGEGYCPNCGAEGRKAGEDD